MKDIEKSLVRIAVALERIANIVEQAYQDEHPESGSRVSGRGSRGKERRNYDGR